MEVPVDWSVLAERYNKIPGKNVSFEGSVLTCNTLSSKDGRIEVQVWPLMVNGTPVDGGQLNRFHIYYDEGTFKSMANHSSAPFKGPDHLAISSYVLIHIVSEFIAPFLKKTYPEYF